MSVVGARPNFMKIAPFVHALQAFNREQTERGLPAVGHCLVHTGQHYNRQMSALTLRSNTERPITLEENGGVNVLVGNDANRLRQAFAAKRNQPRRVCQPPLWDGHTKRMKAEG